MLSTATLTGFVPTRNAQQARDFFENVLGLQLLSQDQFATVFQSGGNMIRVVPVREWTPLPFTILGWEVEDIEAELTSLKQRGVNFQRYPWMGQDGLEIWTAPEGSRIAWFTDPDGNILSLAQHPS